LAEPISTGRRIVRAMFIIIFFYFFWKFGGFLLNVLIGSLFPSGIESDAFLCAYTSVIYLFYGIVLKFFMPAFMPLFMEEMEKKGEDAAWRFASSTINIMLVILGGAILLGFIFTPQIMRAIAEGYFRNPDDPRGEMTIRWVRIMLPGLLGACIGIFTYALLNSYKIFSYPAAGEAGQKLGWAAALAVMVFLLKMGAVAIPIGFLVGVAIQLIINFLGLRPKLRLYKPLIQARWSSLLKELAIFLVFAAVLVGLVKFLPQLRVTGRRQLITFLCGTTVYLLLAAYRSRGAQSLLGRFVGLAAPLLIGVLIARIMRDLITDNYTTFTATGMFSDKKFAEKIGQLPNVIVAYALSIAMFPFLCEYAIKRNKEELSELVNRAVRMIALFFIPLSVTMAILAQPLMQLVFDRGNWQPEHLHYGGIALAFYISGLFFYAVENVLMQTFFSMQQMWTPTIIGLVAAVFHVGFLFTCDYFMHLTDGSAESQLRLFYVVILSFPLSRAFKNLLLMAVLRMRVKILPLMPTAVFAAKVAALCILLGGGVFAAYRFIAPIAGVERLKGRQVVIDTFPTREIPGGWSAQQGAKLSIENVNPPDMPEELALKVEGRVSVSRSLDGFDLRDVDVLKFKIKSDRDTSLEITAHTPDGEFAARLSVRRSHSRVKYTIASDEFKPVQPRAEGAVCALSRARSFEFVETGESTNGALWLDTIILESRFPPSRWVKFELAKALVVGFPFLIALIIGAVLAMVLRVEEARIVWSWLKEKGLSRLLSPPKDAAGGHDDE